MNTKTILFCLFALLLVSSVFAADAATKKTEGTKKASTTTPKAAPKAAPKTTPTTTATPKDEGFSLEQFQKLAITYSNQALDNAQDLLDDARVHFAKYSKVAQDRADQIVDKYFAPETAKVIKTNLFNLYGILAASLALVGFVFTATKINWIFSLNPARAFLSAFGFGVFATIYGLTYLVKDPVTLVAKASPQSVDSFENITFGWFSLLVALNATSIVLKGGFRNILQFLTSALLFVDHFGARAHIEAQTGTLPPHTINLLVFSVLSFLSFAQLEAEAHPGTVINLGYQTKNPSTSSQPISPAGKSTKAGGKKN